MYVELDHGLVPGKIADINKMKELPGRKKEKEGKTHFGRKNTFQLNKYEVKKGDFQELLKNSKKQETEAVAGTNAEVFFDEDWGFFSAILACYNNHWVLKTGPDDWWNVIVRNVAQMVDHNGEKNKVRHFFVDHQGKKEITIVVPDRLDNVDYSWLFDQLVKEEVE